jgi:hypothetical protein
MTNRLFIPMPEFSIVYCEFSGSDATARDGYCGNCGETGHPESD